MKGNYIYKPFRYFFIVNLITWVATLIAAWYSYHLNIKNSSLLISVFIYVVILTPFCTALWIIFISNNSELKWNFLRMLFNLKQIKPRNIPLILFTIPAIAAASILLSTLFGQPLDQFCLVKGAIYSTGAIPAPFILFGAALFEELGWKGYGMDSLRYKFNFFGACFIFGLIWVFWHFPLFFIDGFYSNVVWKISWLYSINYCVSIFVMGFLTSWMWYKNKGCILAAVIVHATANFQGIFQMGQLAKCIETVLMIVVIIVIVCSNKEMYFEQPSGKIGYFVE